MKIADELLWEANRWHQEYGMSQYLVAKKDLQKMQSLMKRAADALQNPAMPEPQEGEA